MATNKAQKRNAARKTAEALKAKKKALRMSKGAMATSMPGKKGKSAVPQAKKK